MPKINTHQLAFSPEDLRKLRPISAPETVPSEKFQGPERTRNRMLPDVDSNHGHGD